LLSSVFDYLTFAALLLLLHADRAPSHKPSHKFK
jgi:hypothetical protein